MKSAIVRRREFANRFSLSEIELHLIPRVSQNFSKRIPVGFLVYAGTRGVAPTSMK